MPDDDKYKETIDILANDLRVCETKMKQLNDTISFLNESILKKDVEIQTLRSIIYRVRGLRA